MTFRASVMPFAGGLAEASIVGRKPRATDETTVLGTCSASMTFWLSEGRVTLEASSLEATRSSFWVCTDS